MNLFLEPPGFLGTGASLLADLTLIIYALLLLPAMIAGTVFARRGLHRPHHKWVMITITAVNWLLIGLLMVAAFLTDVAPNLESQPANPRYALPAAHALFGLPAQLLATYIVIRMLIEDHQVGRARQRGERDLQRYWFKPAKPVMWATLVLWILTTSSGIITYLTRYNVIAVSGAVVPSPAATQEIAAPAATDEAAPAARPEAGEVADPAETPEPAG
ncbi:MAG TPA: hypothetical protein VKY59_05080 [Spirillospora sp.]|nr:hypothetical protein [Spirillospora sp.]